MCVRVCDVEIATSDNPLYEGHRAVFKCIIRIKMARVERVSWHLNSLNLSRVENQRLKITTEHQPELMSKLTLNPVHYSDSGTVQQTVSVFQTPQHITDLALHCRVVQKCRYVS